MVYCPYCNKKLNWFLLYFHKNFGFGFKSFKLYQVGTFRCYHCNSFMHAKNTNKFFSILIGMLLITTWLVIPAIAIFLYIHALQQKLPDGIFAVMLIVLWLVSLWFEWKWWSEHFLELEKSDNH